MSEGDDRITVTDKHCDTEVVITYPEVKTVDGKDVQIQNWELSYWCPDCREHIYPFD